MKRIATYLTLILLSLLAVPQAYAWRHVSPYAYCAGDPVNKMDVDGNMIIFINGKIGGGSPPAGPEYWNCVGNNSSVFVNRAKSFFNDNNVTFSSEDYNYLSSSNSRRKDGYEYAKQNYDNWSSDMEAEESFNLVSHSMGSAFSMGIEDYLKEIGRNVDYNVMINPYQVDHITIKPNSNTQYIFYQNTNDPVLFWFDDNLGYGNLRNADIIIKEESNSDYWYIHRSPIDSGYFWSTLMNYLQNNTK